MNLQSQDQLTAAVYTRPALLLEPVDGKIETIESMAEENVVEDCSLHSWPGKVSVSDEGMYDDVLSVFEEFVDWADANGVSVQPPFSVRTRRSGITGEAATVLSTPVMGLALYVGDRLGWVFPHADGEMHYSVADGIAGLKTGDLPDRTPLRVTPPTEPVGECESCDGPVVNVQGTLACHDCLVAVEADEPAASGRRNPRLSIRR